MLNDNSIDVISIKQRDTVGIEVGDVVSIKDRCDMEIPPILKNGIVLSINGDNLEVLHDTGEIYNWKTSDIFIYLKILKQRELKVGVVK